MALHVGMGLGKTRSVLMALEELHRKKKHKGYRRTLVLGPIPVVESTWPDEIEKWGFDLSYQLIRGTPAERAEQMKVDADIYGCNFEMLHWLADKAHTKWWRELDVLVIDELTKCKVTKSTPYRVLSRRRDWFKKRIGMTGTLLPESYVNLYGQFTVLRKIWDTKIEFIEKYFVDESHNPNYHQYRLKSPKAKRKLRKRVAPYTLTLDSADHLDVPEWSIQDYWFDLSKRQRRHYDKLERDMYLQVGDDPKLIRKWLMRPDDEDTTEVTADTTSSLRMKLRQVISGFLYNEDGESLVFDHTKLKYAQKVTDELDESVFLAYALIEERRALMQTYDAPLLKGRQALKDWNNGKLPYAVGHPLSMGHGINMQDGGRVLVWYSLPRSFEQYAQTIARFVRTGQTQNVIIVRMLARNTIDELIVDDLERKQGEQNDFVEAFKTGNY